MTALPTAITVESSPPEPRTRVRINHAFTQRAGWQYETTVEVEWFDLEDGTAFSRLQDLLAVAREVAKREQAERNAEDGNA